MYSFTLYEDTISEYIWTKQLNIFGVIFKNMLWQTFCLYPRKSQHVGKSFYNNLSDELAAYC